MTMRCLFSLSGFDCDCTGLTYRIHGVSLYATDPAYQYSHIEECLTDMGLTGVRAEDLVNPVVKYVGNGYANSREEELGK